MKSRSRKFSEKKIYENDLKHLKINRERHYFAVYKKNKCLSPFVLFSQTRNIFNIFILTIHKGTVTSVTPIHSTASLNWNNMKVQSKRYCNSVTLKFKYQCNSLIL